MTTFFEKHFCPKSISDIVFANDFQHGHLLKIVNNQIPFPICSGKCAILLHGRPGTGKSALAKILPDAMEYARSGEQADEEYINIKPGSNGVDVIERISGISGHGSWSGKHHYFILDEFDNLSTQAMASLKSVMNAPNCVFILTTNNFHKIEAGVKDRSFAFKLDGAPAARWLPFAKRVLKYYKVAGIPDSDIEQLIAPLNGTARDISSVICNLVAECYIKNGIPMP